VGQGKQKNMSTVSTAYRTIPR